MDEYPLQPRGKQPITGMGSAATRMGYGVKVSEFIMHKFRGGLIRRKNHALPSFRLVERMLYGIGAQKAGTTWLYEQMKSHPQVYMGVSLSP